MQEQTHRIMVTLAEETEPGVRVQNIISKTIAIVTHNINLEVPWVKVRYQRRNGQVVKTAWWVKNVQVFK